MARNSSQCFPAKAKSQQQPTTTESRFGVTWRSVAYDDKAALTEVLRGVHTVLSFIQLLSDPNQQAQRTLVEACIAAGVKRFAPSEYGRYDSQVVIYPAAS